MVYKAYFNKNNSFMVLFLCLCFSLTYKTINMRHSKSMPEVNAGSMADIAFLLLIFFLVTAAIPKDHGIIRKLPAKCPDGQICDSQIKKHNLLTISINDNNDIMINKDIITIDKLKDITKDFVDNNGDESCTFCEGVKSPTSSDNPKKAVISLQNGRNTDYGKFIEVQDELTKAYYELRTAYSKKIFNKFPEDLSKKEMKQVKEAYPFILSEAQTK